MCKDNHEALYRETNNQHQVSTEFTAPFQDPWNCTPHETAHQGGLFFNAYAGDFGG
jgi:hypothetical protein